MAIFMPPCSCVIRLNNLQSLTESNSSFSFNFMHQLADQEKMSPRVIFNGWHQWSSPFSVFQANKTLGNHKSAKNSIKNRKFYIEIVKAGSTADCCT